MSQPSVIFSNLQNSGSSAIVPILSEIFSVSGYFLTPYGPEGTDRLKGELSDGKITGPFFHWSHDPVDTFEGMIGDPDYRFIYLRRDPRDAAVSWAHDFENRWILKGIFQEIL